MVNQKKSAPSRCPLCLETKVVVSSHLIPKRMSDYCRPPGGNPISVMTELVIETARQVQDRLLCMDCEDLLNKGGEMWLLPLLARYEGLFRSTIFLRSFPRTAQ